MILPRRIADQHSGRGVDLAQEVGAELETAGAAQRLDGHDPSLADQWGIGPEDQLAHVGGVAGQTVDRQITARLGVFGEPLLGVAGLPPPAAAEAPPTAGGG